MNKKMTFKWILILFMSMIISVMTILLVVVLENTKSFSDQLDSDLNRIVMLQTKVDEMNMATSAISNYAVSGDGDYQNEYITLTKELKSFVESNFANKEKAQSETNGYYLYYDLNNMYQSFVEQAEVLVVTFESGRSSVYIDDEINELTKNNNFVKAQLSQIISFELGVVESKYGNIEETASRREEMVYFVVFLVIVITLALGTIIAKRLAEPIHKLSMALSLIGKGHYDMPPLDAEGTGEISQTIKDFNTMKEHLSVNIDLIHENASIKDQLRTKEIDLLEKENHLKQSKLDFLQSQINPHFLYNTLNSIQTLADIEEAPQTEKMLNHLSRLMRYNVKKTNTVVLLSEEIEVIGDYVYIQLIRFGNRIKYEVDCDEEALQTGVPSMILQPLVENAMIHGLEPKMGQGLLKLSAKLKESEDSYVELIVEDNGLGMPEETINRLMAYGEASEKESEDMMKNVKSIGVANVIRRCRLYYGENIVSIESEVNEGTRFVFRIPVEH